MSGTEIALRRPPVVTFSGGPHRFEADMVGAPRFAIAYRVPENTCDPRYAACTDHHVACDCREAEQAEQLDELRATLKEIRGVAARALAGHQLQPPAGLNEWQRRIYPVCLCSGCVIARECPDLVLSIDWTTGRFPAVRP